MTINIVETNLKFKNDMAVRKSTNRIVIHHSDSDAGSAAVVHGWHLNKGWAGIGYHFVIKRDGVIERGRPIQYVGAHTEGSNSDSIGICCIGNFMTYGPNEAQLKSLIALIQYLQDKYGNKLKVFGHRELMATACPGTMFDLNAFRARLNSNKNTDDNNGGNEEVVDAWKTAIMTKAKEIGLISEDHKPDDTATKWFVLSVVLKAIEIIQKMIKK